MPVKQRSILRFLLGMTLSGTATALLLDLNLPGLWGTVLQELERGIVTLVFGGVSASLGILLSEEILLFDGHLLATLLRLALLIFPHLALGLLWQRYRCLGGLAAVIEHLAWNQWLASPYWIIPTTGMGAIYLTLLFHKESVPA